MSGSDASGLAAILDGFPRQVAWVAGDIMLDEYVMGEVRRISPEAPVPVVRVRDSQMRLGGAANVAAQIATLGGAASLMGVVGADVAGDTVLETCAARGIDTRAVHRLEATATTRKVRVLGQRQQLLRLDWEETASCPRAISGEMLRRLGDGPAPDVVILSDYAKGFLSPQTIRELVAAARSRGVLVLVDPKRLDFTAYRGATVITPNLKELAAASGRALEPADEDAVASAARALAAACEAEALVVTLGERGMLVVPRRGDPVSVRGYRRAVFDVTGAGDTAIATLALGLAAGAGLRDAAQLANTAAGIAVGRVGTTAVPAADIRGALARHPGAKVLARGELSAQVETWRLQGKRIVFTNGCFDLLHIGHLSLLRQAAQLGDVLILAINSDPSVHRLKGDGRPLVPAAERAALLSALDCVDAVTIFDQDTPLETLELVVPDVLVKGEDYRLEDVVGRELVEGAGGRVELVPLLPERSTSALLERIRERRSS